MGDGGREWGQESGMDEGSRDEGRGRPPDRTQEAPEERAGLSWNRKALSNKSSTCCASSTSIALLKSRRFLESGRRSRKQLF